MKKKIIITFLFILGLILVNSISFYRYYYNYVGKYFYNSGRLYLESSVFFNKAGNIYGKYNEANSLYKQKKYDEALKKYNEIVKNKKNKINFYLNHNIGNTYYRIGENLIEQDKKIKNYEDSISSYKKALEITLDEETKKNKEFVEKKLEEVRKQTSPQPSPQGEGEGKGEKQEKSGSGSEQKTGSGAKEQKTGTGQQNTGSGNEDEKSELTKEQQAEIKKYEQFLNDIQSNNQDQFNKVYEENNDIIDELMNNPLFDNSLLEEDSGKKDW